jgi:hypothetical protein
LFWFLCFGISSVNKYMVYNRTLGNICFREYDIVFDLETHLGKLYDIVGVWIHFTFNTFKHDFSIFHDVWL